MALCGFLFFGVRDSRETVERVEDASLLFEMNCLYCFFLVHRDSRSWQSHVKALFALDSPVTS